MLSPTASLLTVTLSVTSHDYVEGAKLVIYQLEDGKNTQCKIYDKDAKLELTVMAERNGDTITVTHTATDKNFTVESAEGLKVVINK